MKPITIFLIILSLFGVAACKKKDRLSSSTSSFAVVPAAATVLSGGQKTFTAKFIHASGQSPADASWTISPSTTGAGFDTGLNTQVGSSIIYTPASGYIGDVVITAISDGSMAISSVAVVSYIPNTTNVFDAYTDAGLPLGSDIITSLSATELVEVSSGFTPEGIKYLRTTGAINSDFWAVELGTPEDLSGYAAGTMRFSVRLKAPLGAGGLQIQVKDSGAGVGTVNLDTVIPSTTVLDWQEVSIPLASFFGSVDETQVLIPFLILRVGANYSFDIDAVRWHPN